MSHETIGEQLVVFGAVDIPLNNDNTIKALQGLGPKGYMPNVVQEVNLQDGRSVNRLSLINPSENTTIVFNQQRITIARAPAADGVMSAKDFSGVIKEICAEIHRIFDITANRFVIVREKFLSQKNIPEMQEVYGRFIAYGSESEPFEWLFRASAYVGDGEQRLLRLIELNRAQGVIFKGGVESDFDRIRAKVEVGTDMRDTTNRYKLDQIAEFIDRFNALMVDTFSEVERVYG